MRNTFAGFHPPSTDELDRLWSSALVVVDTNVLLNLYRLSPQAREKLISVLEAYSDRLWIPHQVGAEFHDNRVDEIRNQQAMGAKLLQALSGFQSAFAKVLDGYSLNVDVKFLEDDFAQVVADFSEKVKTVSSEHVSRYGVSPQRDPILTVLESLFEGRVGPPWSAEELERLYVEAEARYSDKIPPGFRDAKDKQAPRKYGDYILWTQILSKAESDKVDVLFVTDDKKSDWWWESQGQLLGPEPRLRDEFRAVSGNNFYAYRSSQFIRESDGRRAVPVNERIVEEIQTTSDAYAERERAALDLARELGAAEQALSVTRERAEHASRHHAVALENLKRIEDRRKVLAEEQDMLHAQYDEYVVNKVESPSFEYSERMAELGHAIRRIERERVAAERDTMRAHEEFVVSAEQYKRYQAEAEYLQISLLEKEAKLRSLDIVRGKE